MKAAGVQQLLRSRACQTAPLQLHIYPAAQPTRTRHHTHTDKYRHATRTRTRAHLARDVQQRRVALGVPGVEVGARADRGLHARLVQLSQRLRPQQQTDILICDGGARTHQNQLPAKVTEAGVGAPAGDKERGRRPCAAPQASVR